MPFSKRHLGLLLAFSLAALSWWWQQYTAETGDSRRAVDEQLVDYSLTDFSVTAMNDQGRPRHRLQATHMVHFADTDYAEVTAPELEMFSQDGETIRLRAEQAQVYKGGDPVLFQGAVTIVQLDKNRQQILELLTRDVWFYADREFAETDAAVTLRDAIGVTHAEGMKVDMKAGSLRLLAAVRGRYVVQ